MDRATRGRVRVEPLLVSTAGRLLVLTTARYQLAAESNSAGGLVAHAVS
jgi:hypothetical protein